MTSNPEKKTSSQGGVQIRDFCHKLAKVCRRTGEQPWEFRLRTVVRDLECERWVMTLSIIKYNFCFTNYMYLPS